MNIFDGQNGRSDGTSNGASQDITGNGNLVNVFVSGTFGGASVTIQKFVHTDNDYASTSAVFTSADIFQGLMVRPSDRFRLVISGATATTALIAEVN